MDERSARHSLDPDGISSVEPGFSDYHNLSPEERARLFRRVEDAGVRAYGRAERAAWERYWRRIDRGEIGYAAAQAAVVEEATRARREASERVLDHY